MDAKTLLQELLQTQIEMLGELRLLRQAVEAKSSLPQPRPTAPEPAPQATAPTPEPPAAPQTPDAPPAPQLTPQRPKMMTMDELTDLGGEILKSGSRAKTRLGPGDIAELGGSLIDGIKAKNRSKRDAFAEFDRLRRQR